MPRPANAALWTPKDWQEFHRERFESLDPAVRAEAVAFLRRELSDVVREEIRERMRERPGRWIGGRGFVKCALCNGTKKTDGGDRCPLCDGTGQMHDAGLHMTWGMGVRNLLRTHGFGEKRLGVENLDDYYVALVEAAVLAK